MKQDVAIEAAKAAPPVAISTLASVQGWDMSHWVGAATFAYVLLQAAYLAWKWWREYKASQ